MKSKINALTTPYAPELDTLVRNLTPETTSLNFTQTEVAP